MSKKFAVLASGGGTNFQALIDGGLAKYICVLISNNPSAFALQRAKLANIETAVCLTEDEVLAKLKNYSVDFIVLAGYLKILSKEFVAQYRGKIINIHPSLLPLYKGLYGLAVHEAVIKNGETKTGATVHFVDEGIDTGDIILQEKIEVLKGDTPQSLQKRVLEEVEHKILVKVVKSLLGT